MKYDDLSKTILALYDIYANEHILKVPMPRLLAELWHAYFRSRVWKRGFLLLDLIPGRR